MSLHYNLYLTTLVQVVSDWGGTHSGHQAIAAGQDMDMPGGLSFGNSAESSFFGRNITSNVNNGSVSTDRLDDMCRRIMTPYFHLNQQQYPPVDGSTPLINGHGKIVGLQTGRRY